MQYTINQLYDLLHERVNTIYDTFKGFFGEANVDLQEAITKQDFISLIIEELERNTVILDYRDSEYKISYELTDEVIAALKNFFANKKDTIYVWWNRVTITNENDKSINIQDLYAKVEVTFEGRIPYENWGFLLNRATYTKEQFQSEYCHSHICNIPKDNFTKFQQPCLGTGPIKETIATLKNEYDEAEWMLFCQELSMYVTVESLTGRPYNYLEEVRKREDLYIYGKYDFINNAEPNIFLGVFGKDTLKDFIKYYLEKGHLSIAYKNNKYCCGMPYYEYIIDISNAFIDYYNEHLAKSEEKKSLMFSKKLLVEVVVINNKLYTNRYNESYANLDRYKGKLVLRFKGKDIRTTILEEEDNQEQTPTTVLNNNVAMYILKNILRTINFRYINRNKYGTAKTDDLLASISKRVSYI